MTTNGSGWLSATTLQLIAENADVLAIVVIVYIIYRIIDRVAVRWQGVDVDGQSTKRREVFIVRLVKAAIAGLQSFLGASEAAENKLESPEASKVEDK